MTSSHVEHIPSPRQAKIKTDGNGGRTELLRMLHLLSPLVEGHGRGSGLGKSHGKMLSDPLNLCL